MTHVPAARKTRIYLTGFMGSGKSTIGPVLANTLGYNFLDVDKEIERRAGMSVAEFFRVRGEGAFRALEQGVIQETSTAERTIIALGGGSLVDPANFQTVTTSGILVYLKVPFAEIFRRIRSKSDRPMLLDAEGKRLDDEKLRERVLGLFTAREPLYARADITIGVDDTKMGLTVDRIVRRLLPLLR